MLGEWRSFEQRFGPLLAHERIDYGFALLAAITARDSDVRKFLPPWYDVKGDSEEQMLQALFRLKEKFGKGE